MYLLNVSNHGDLSTMDSLALACAAGVQTFETLLNPVVFSLSGVISETHFAVYGFFILVLYTQCFIM